MDIVPYENKWKEVVRIICKKTAGQLEDRAAETYLYEMYCDNYLENETTLLLSDQDKVVGYILCAEDYDSYVGHMKQHRENIEKLGGYYPMRVRGEMEMYREYKEEYPAHLHVDILEEYTGKGGGRMLMEALFAELRKKSVSGVMLIVSAENKRAVSYYKKMGFSALKENEYVIVMGKKL